MDLSLLIANDTADCTIVNPITGKDSDIVITVYASHTKQARDARLKAGDLKDVERFAEYLADITTGWVNVELEGKELIFNRKNALDIYNHKGQIVAVQIANFLGDEKSFLPKR